MSRLLMLALALAAAFSFAGPARAAKKTTVYVLKQTYYNKKAKKNLDITYQYNKNGLLKGYSRANGMIRAEYTYDRNWKITKFRRSMNQWATFDYGYNKKNQLVSINGYYTNMSDNKFAYDGLKTKYTYNKKGRVVKEVTTGEEYDFNTEKMGKGKYTITYSYDKKGRLTVRKETHKLGKKTYRSTIRYAYDKKGNPVKVTQEAGNIEYTNSYDKKGNLVKCTAKNEGQDDADAVVTVFTWKKMKIDPKLAAAVKAQQESLLSGNNRGLSAIPTNDYNGM